MRKIVYQYKDNKKNTKFSIDSVRKFVYSVVKHFKSACFQSLKYEKSYRGGGTMLTNLEEVRKQKNVTLVDIADLLKIRYQTVSDKINGISDFKFGEALLIKNTFFPEYEIEYLFSREKEKVAT